MSPVVMEDLLDWGPGSAFGSRSRDPGTTSCVDWPLPRRAPPAKMVYDEIIAVSQLFVIEKSQSYERGPSSDFSMSRQLPNSEAIRNCGFNTSGAVQFGTSSSAATSPFGLLVSVRMRSRIGSSEAMGHSDHRRNQQRPDDRERCGDETMSSGLLTEVSFR